MGKPCSWRHLRAGCGRKPWRSRQRAVEVAGGKVLVDHGADNQPQVYPAVAVPALGLLDIRPVILDPHVDERSAASAVLRNDTLAALENGRHFIGAETTMKPWRADEHGGGN